MDRRKFVQTCVIGGAGTLAGVPFVRTFAQTPTPTPVNMERIVFQPAHHLRDGGSFPAPPPSEEREIVIVGAGPTGLCAAYALRDRDILLLEKEPKTGGNAQRDQWNGTWFTQAAAFMDQESDFADFIKGEFGLVPTPLHSNDALIVDGQVVHDLFHEGWKNLPYPEPVRQDFGRFFAQCRELAPVLWPELRDLFRNQATPDSALRRQALALQNQTFAQWLAENDYSREVQSFCDLYCPPQVSSYPDVMTALMAIVYFGYAGSYEGSGTFPGGLGIIAETLSKAVAQSGADRIRTDSFVTSVFNDAQGQFVDVTYTRGGEMHTVRAKQCLWGAHLHIASRVIRDMPREQVEAIGHLTYLDITVMNLCYRRQIYNEAYQTWLDGAPIVNLLPADWVIKQGSTDPEAPQVLSCDWPNRTRDRALLLDDAWVVEQCQKTAHRMEEIFPGSIDHLEEIRVKVRAHSWVHDTPGWLAMDGSVRSRAVGRVLIGDSAHASFEMAWRTGTALALEARNRI